MIKAAAAKIAGRSHVSTKTPCQDAVRTRNLRSKVCIALADGAGSKKFSRTGANAVVRLATHQCLEFFDRYHEGILRKKEGLESEIIDDFKAELAARARKRHRPIGDYACTLLFFACVGGRYIAGHIGDGAIFARFGERLVTLSEPENGEYTNTTFFVTDPDASNHLRLYAGHFDGSLDLMLLSDGTAESLLDRSTRQAGAGVSRLMDVFRDLTATQMTRVLKKNLELVLSLKSADDCSIAMTAVSRNG